MTSFLIDTDTIIVRTLDQPFDYGFITRTGILRSNGVSVTISGTSTWLVNDGTIFSLDFPVLLTTAATGAVIENAGRISGQDFGILSNAPDLKLTNQGTISSAGAALYLTPQASGTNAFVNTGTITGGTSGISGLGTGLGSLAINNAGTISGLGGSAVDINGIAVTLTNTGTITTGHSGVSPEAIRFISIQADRINNTGTIIGSIALGSGDDTYLGAAGGFVSGTILGEAGTDILTGSDLRDRLDGGTGNDSLSGKGGDDFLDGKEDNDQLLGGDGADLLLGGSGDDRLFGEAGDDFILGGTGADILNGGDGADQLYADAGEDTLVGGDGADVLGGDADDDDLEGGAGNDTLMGGAGSDLLDGGDGQDVASYRGTAQPVLADLADDSQNLGEAAGDQFVSVENMEGGAGNDTLRGDSGANVLAGGYGDDQLDGRAGADVLRGGRGNDLLVVDNARDRVVERQGHGVDTVEASASWVLALGAEVEVLRTTNVNGTGGVNLTGNELANDITGNAGANRLTGRAGNDTLSGGAGDDTLVGGEGADSLTGGTGLDAFLLNSTIGVDSIADFAPVDDVIQLSRGGLGFSHPLAALNANAFAFGTAATTAQQRFLYDQATGTLYFDGDGVGAASAATAIAVLSGAPVVTLADFVVVA